MNTVTLVVLDENNLPPLWLVFVLVRAGEIGGAACLLERFIAMVLHQRLKRGMKDMPWGSSEM